MTKPAPSLLTLENTVSAPIETGDAGIILRADGSFKVFSTGDLQGGELSPAQLEQGRKLMALAVALKHPEIMNVLHTMAADPAIVGDGIEIGRPN